MKYLFLVFSILFVLAGCSSPSENEMRLTGEVKGLKKGTLVLQKVEDTTFVSLDSMVIDGTPEFDFSEEILNPEVYYLALRFEDSSDVVKRLPFFAEAGNIVIHTTLKNYGREAVISGSVNQEKMDQYRSLMKRFSDQNLELIEEGLNAMKDGNDSTETGVRYKQDRLIKGMYLASVNFAMNHNEYEVAPYIMLTELYDINPKYLDTVYTSLTPKIKDSKYGKALESLIQSRKE